MIDRNYYPVEEARRSNMRHWPIGLGVQGLEDAFMIRLPFENETAQRPSFDIVRHHANWPPRMDLMKHLQAHQQVKDNCSSICGELLPKVAVGIWQT